MATFKGTAQPAAEASRLLHPSAMVAPSTGIDPVILADIALGLAASIDPGLEVDQPLALELSAAYDASVVELPADGNLLVTGVGRESVAVGVVRGAVLVWTVDDGVHALNAGGACGAEPRERLQVVNLSSEPVLLVIVRAPAPLSLRTDRSRRFTQSLVI